MEIWKIKSWKLKILYYKVNVEAKLTDETG